MLHLLEKVLYGGGFWIFECTEDIFLMFPYLIGVLDNNFVYEWYMKRSFESNIWIEYAVQFFPLNR